MTSNQPTSDPSQSNTFASFEGKQENSAPNAPPTENANGGQQGSNLTVRRVVRPVHGQGGQNYSMSGETNSPSVQGIAEGEKASSLIRPPFPGQPAILPPSTNGKGTNNKGLSLKSFAGNEMNFLPATSAPGVSGNDNNDTNRPAQSFAGVQTLQTPQHALPVTPPGVHIPSQAVRSVKETRATYEQNAKFERLDENHVVLHRAPNFFVATVARAGITPPSMRRRSGQTTILPAYAPQQSARVAASETRMMPKVGPINPMQPRAIPFPRWAEAIVVVIGLIIAGIAHAYNMFNYPQYSLDEGTYMSSAWAIVHGMLAPYPYGYGHPPLGWIQIAAWVQMTGGFFTFGDATNTGRVLMMFFAVGSALLVYLIMRRLHGSRAAALLAMVIFSLSPLCIAYQRMVLLDNIATFWLLLSLYFIVISNSRLLFIVLAAIAFGISLLSKEVMLLFLPAMIYGVWLHTTKFQRKFALVAFIYCFVAIGSTFVLMAILRGELLPPISWLPGDNNPHLSFLSTYLTQVQRGQSQGSLSLSFTTWDDQDLLFIILALAAPLFNLVVGWWDRKVLLVALLTLSFWLLFVRNGVVFAFYIIPLLPLSAFNIAIACNTILQWLHKGVSSLLGHSDQNQDARSRESTLIAGKWRREIVRVLLLCIILLTIATYDVQHSSQTYQGNLTYVQTDALTWLRDNVPHNAVIVINSYFYTDLHEQGGEGVGDGTIFQHADIYWNVAYDPELHDGLLNNNWDNIDYIVTDAPMFYDIEHLGGDMDLIDQALHHSVLRVNFQPSIYDPQDAIQVYQVIHKNAPSTSYSGPTMKVWNGAEIPALSVRNAGISAPFYVDTRKTQYYGSNTTQY